MKERLARFFDEKDDPNEPVYDPVDFCAMLLVTLTAIGALFWLLWTLFVFEGRVGNAAALVLTAVGVALLYRAYRDAENAARRP